jgi:hypothetical protein
MQQNRDVLAVVRPGTESGVNIMQLYLKMLSTKDACRFDSNITIFCTKNPFKKLKGHS